MKQGQLKADDGGECSAGMDPSAASLQRMKENTKMLEESEAV